MTSSSKRSGPRQVPPPKAGDGPAFAGRAGGDKPASAYARFIPREELGDFASWTPGSFGSFGGAAAAAQPEAPSAPSEQEIGAQLHAARQAGYQDGYRDGLVALEGFKQSFAAQMTAQIGTLVQAFGSEIEGLEQQMARSLAQAATQLARQVVRSELVTRPEAIAQVAGEAINAVLMTARHITVRVHPDDHPLVLQGAAEAIEARSVRVMPDAAIRRGGCVVESDVGVIDAGIEARWAQASTQLGGEVAWDDEAAK
jgi:flagellar assembly protein FliH